MDELPSLIIHTICLFLDFGSCYQFIQVSKVCYSLGHHVLTTSNNLLCEKFKTYSLLSNIPFNKENQLLYRKWKRGRITSDPMWEFPKQTDQTHRGILISHLGAVVLNKYPVTLHFILKINTVLSNMPTIKRYFYASQPISVNPIIFNRLEQTCVSSAFTSDSLTLFFDDYHRVGVFVDFKTFNIKILDSNIPLSFDSIKSRDYRLIGSRMKGCLVNIIDSRICFAVFKNYQSSQFVINLNRTLGLSLHKCVNKSKFVLLKFSDEYLIIDLKLQKIVYQGTKYFEARRIIFYFFENNFYLLENNQSLFELYRNKVWKLNSKPELIHDDIDDLTIEKHLFCPVLKKFV